VRKSFAIILITSTILWFISTIIQAVIELYVFGRIGYTFFGSGCSTTGYPFAVCANQFDNTRYGYYFINIAFWFVVVAYLWNKTTSVKKHRKKLSPLKNLKFIPKFSKK
jgi:bacteriorhodopsin